MSCVYLVFHSCFVFVLWLSFGFCPVVVLCLSCSCLFGFCLVVVLWLPCGYLVVVFLVFFSCGCLVVAALCLSCVCLVVVFLVLTFGVVSCGCLDQGVIKGVGLFFRQDKTKKVLRCSVSVFWFCLTQAKDLTKEQVRGDGG
jgi:hypothetical protein